METQIKPHPTGQFIEDPLAKLYHMSSIRKAAGWTQQDFAKHLNVPQSTISGWEKQTHKPDFANGYRLMVLLDQLQAALLKS